MSATLSTALRQASLLPGNSLGERLCTIFSYLWNTIAAPNEPGPKWETLNKHPLRPRVLWQGWQDSMKLVGVRFGNETEYGLFDIDIQSPYHPLQDPTAIVTLRAALETIGIYRTVLITSSCSGGLHLYIPLPHLVPTFGLASALKQCVEAQGFEVSPGKLEIFPNTKAYGFGGEFVEYNAHRLPLQPASGSVLLDADGNPTSSDLGRFFVAWDWAAAGQSLEEVRAAIAIARSNGNKRRRRRLTIVEDWRQDLQTEINEGWTGYGQTNALLKTIACYGVVFEHLTGEALSEFVQDTAENAPGYAEFCRHHHEITRRSTVWAKAAEKYYWALGTEPKREGSFLDRPEDNKVIPINRNVQRAEDAQQRIRAAIEQMTTEGQLPAEATPRKEALERQGISSRTLYKYLDLWHPAHLPPDVAIQTAECKTDRSEAVSATFTPEMTETEKSPEALQNREVYTLEDNMKCYAFLKAKFLCLDPNRASGVNFLFSGAFRRELLTESVTIKDDEKTLKPLLEKDSNAQTGTSSSIS